MEEPTLESLQLEQAQLELSEFNSAFVWKYGSRLYGRARNAGHPVAIEIRHGMDVVFSVLAPGATIDNFDWTRRKCAVVHRFHRSSLFVKLEAKQKGYDFNTRFRLPPADFVAGGGGVPLLLKGGTFIGSVGVSGLPDVEDHRLVVDTLTEVLAE